MRWLKISLSVAAIGILLAASAAWYASGQLVAPANSAIGDPPAWLNGQRVQFSSDSGSEIQGWFAPVLEPRAAVVLLHPVRGNRRSMLGRARFLRKAGLSVLLIDLQGHGESGGEHITFGHLESMDAAAAVNFVQDAVQGVPVVVLGSSLGGAAAVLATPELPVDGLILEAVYPTVENAVRNRLEIRIGNVGSLLAPLLLSQLEPRIGVEPQMLRPMDRIGQVAVPVFVISGENDRRTTRDDTIMLYDSYGGPKRLWLVPGARHQDLHAFAGAKYEERLLRFIDEIVQSAT